MMGTRTQHSDWLIGTWSRKEMISELLSAARGIMDNWDNLNSSTGLCGNIDWAMPTYCQQSYLHSVFEKWPEYSGNEYYPVPAPEDFVAARGLTPAMAVYEYADDDKKYIGEYGEARKRLLAFIIETAQNDLEAYDAV